MIAPKEYRGEVRCMRFKEGCDWKACSDEAAGRFFGEYGDFQSYSLYELTEEQYDALQAGMTESEAVQIMTQGRHLYMSVNDRCGPPYTIVFDDECRTLCPWAKLLGGDNVWPEALTDAAVELFESEKNNRPQRQKKRAARKKAKEENREEQQD